MIFDALKEEEMMPVTTLIVDDSVDFRALLRRRLEGIGCTILAEAGDSSKGLELFRSLKPQLVTLDLMMPDLPDFSARELFRTIRAESPETAVILMSTQPERANASTFLAGGAMAYIDKSFFNFDEVKKVLRAIFPELA